MSRGATHPIIYSSLFFFLACKENKEAEERDCTVNKNETILPEIEPTMSSAQIVNAHLLVPNSSHAEPLPPGVDQPEMPYAIAAASIEPPVIFSTAQQANASIYAATMSDPTNLSLLGHHHPLVGNQLVHYPAYHPHLQNVSTQNIIQTVIKLCLHLFHSGIYFLVLASNNCCCK